MDSTHAKALARKGQCTRMVRTMTKVDEPPQPDHRCGRPAHKDGLCKQHHPDTVPRHIELTARGQAAEQPPATPQGTPSPKQGAHWYDVRLEAQGHAQRERRTLHDDVALVCLQNLLEQDGHPKSLADALALARDCYILADAMLIARHETDEED